MTKKITFYSVQDAEDFLLNESLSTSYYIFSIIENMINNNIERDILFHIEIDDSVVDMSIDNSKLESPLKKCLKAFEDEEDYELCSKCLKYIYQITNSI